MSLWDRLRSLFNAKQRKEGQPFFAQVQLAGGKNNGNFAGHRKTKERPTDTDPAKVEVMPYYPDHSIIRREIAHHYDCIRQTDDEVGQIIAALDEDGLPSWVAAGAELGEKTIVPALGFLDGTMLRPPAGVAA